MGNFELEFFFKSIYEYFGIRLGGGFLNFPSLRISGEPESGLMLTLTLMMSASLSSLLSLAEMLVQDWDSWRLLVEVEEVAGTERDSREEVRAGPSLSGAAAAAAAGAGTAGVGVDGGGRSLDRVQ